MMVKRISRTQALSTALVLATIFGAASAEGIHKKLRFARGSNSATVEGAVLRGDRDEYVLGARAGQKMTVSITSLEDNAVFQIYKPDGKETLEGAGEEEDATEWSGRLPVAGNYLIVVGGTRGNTSYKLKVKIE